MALPPASASTRRSPARRVQHRAGARRHGRAPPGRLAVRRAGPGGHRDHGGRMVPAAPPDRPRRASCSPRLTAAVPGSRRPSPGAGRPGLPGGRRCSSDRAGAASAMAARLARRGPPAACSISACRRWPWSGCARTPAGAQHLLWLLIVIWATDICAYLVGRAVGGPRLAPRISPGKTWAGLLRRCGRRQPARRRWRRWRSAPASAWPPRSAAVLAVVGQAGDLFESVLKRRAGVKDSGHLIPGHGGLLDRIDGLVFAAPAFAAWSGWACRRERGHDGPAAALAEQPTTDHRARRHGLDRPQHAGARRRGARSTTGSRR